MSGWIKFEKSLETDPRTLRVAKELACRFVIFDRDDPRNDSVSYDSCNALAFQYVTLVCGALARLWIFADSHCRSDDTLDMSAAEADEWLGIPGFCSLLPDDWLIELEDGRVELPGFQSHNGVEAKKRALTQKRVARHRNAQALQPNKARNAAALPDQTRPDQIRPDQNQRERGACAPAPAPSAPEQKPRAKTPSSTRIPDDFALTAERRAIAEAEHLAPERTFAKFCDYWRSASGTKARKLDWDATWRNWCRREADDLGNKRPGRSAANVTPLVPRKTADEYEAEARARGEDPYALIS